MKDSQKLLLGAGLVLIGYAALAAGSRLVKAGDNLVVETDTDLTATFTGLRLTVKPTFKNPTQQPLRITHPFVKLQITENDAAPLASSAVVTQQIVIPAFGQVSAPNDFAPIVIDYSWVSLAMAAPSLIAAIRNKSMALTTITITNLITSTNQFLPITKVDVVKLS